MKIATVAASPVVGGKLVSVDDSKAMSIKGVRQIVRLEDAVAVVADNMWAANQGLKALVIRWDDGPNGQPAPRTSSTGLAAAVQSPGVGRAERRRCAAGSRRRAEQARVEYEVPFRRHAAMNQ